MRSCGLVGGSASLGRSLRFQKSMTSPEAVCLSLSVYPVSLPKDQDVVLSHYSNAACCHAPCHNDNGLNLETVSRPLIDAFFH